MAISRMTTRLINGAPLWHNEIGMTTKGYYYDYRTIIEHYAEVFGEKNIIVRLFDRTSLTDGDVRADFEALLGLPREMLGRAPDSNTSFSAPAMAFLAEWNALNPRGKSVASPDPSRERLGLLVTALRENTGPRLRLSPERIEVFLAPYREGNEWVRQRFFPERASLFPEDYKENPVGGFLAWEADRFRRSAARAAAVLYEAFPSEADAPAEEPVATAAANG